MKLCLIGNITSKCGNCLGSRKQNNEWTCQPIELTGFLPKIPPRLFDKQMAREMCVSCGG